MTLHFNHNYDDIYIKKLKSYLNHIHTIQDPIERVNYFFEALWLAAIESFPHTNSLVHQSHRHYPRNLWFDTKCKTLHRII